MWTELADSAPPRPGLVRRRVLPGSERDIFLAVGHPSGERMLVLKVEPAALTAVTDLPSTRVVRTTVVEVDASRSEVRVSLAAPEMLRVFAPFVEDVARFASREPDDPGALRAFATRFAHWRRLLAGEGSGGLGRERAQGLWGELWVMERVLRPLWGDGAVDAWTGADADDKDFRRGALAVEVKTTRADAPHLVRINGAHQLEAPQGAQLLLLAVLEVDSHEGGTGETLNDAVRAARTSAGGSALDRLEEKLAAYGYRDEDAALYRSVHYSLRACAWHDVRPGFPRITPPDVPRGVGAVSYLLSTDACAPFRLDDTQLGTHLTAEGRRA